MAKRSTTARLQVFVNAQLIGELDFRSQRGQKLLRFTYADGWLARDAHFPISRSLPLREDPYVGESVVSYFDNLLPDDISIRQRVAARMHADSDHVFDLLAVVGRDCVGALQFVREGEEPPVLGKPEGTRVSDEQIEEKLKHLKAEPLGASEDEDFRLSIAGAQEKTAFLKLRGRWYVPHGSTPTSHIFKPGLGEMKSGLSFADSIENEWLCSRLTSAFGLPTTNCEIAQFGSVRTLVVERFDRGQLSDGRRIRIPQEDFCQALEVPSFSKYESEGGPGIGKIMSVLSESEARDDDRERFMKTQVVFYLLAAIDGHAKNFSLRWGPRGFRLTPLYDVISAQPLVDRKAIAIQKLKMAMAYGESRHYKLNEILRRHFVQSAKSSQFSAVRMEELIEETLMQVPRAISLVEDELPPRFPASVSDSIFSGLRKRAEKLGAG